MSFRQLPALGPDGEAYLITEFQDDAPRQQQAQHDAHHDSGLRYELADGRKLIRRGQQFVTTGGELTLTAV
ncbi:hypothetical protein QE400_002340 [Xanthomonas sacchari]|uniref:hypothetical protein n=1 Tax=Xanthomonas sacchari TaxID=56458 RepID=UPI0020C4635F|nr:hypothetical protein [Xanthomonas sacchari]MDQ1092927.1 hypothetical protein [Xanthomonas sacchari]